MYWIASVRGIPPGGSSERSRQTSDEAHRPFAVIGYTWLVVLPALRAMVNALVLLLALTGGAFADVDVLEGHRAHPRHPNGV